MRDWPAAQRLIERHAERCSQRTGQTLRDWVVALPEATLEYAPWSPVLARHIADSLEPEGSEEHLERAFRQFTADGDPMAQALAAAGMIESYFFEWSDFHPMRRWLDTLEPLLDRLNFSGRSSLGTESLHESVARNFVRGTRPPTS